MHNSDKRQSSVSQLIENGVIQYNHSLE